MNPNIDSGTMFGPFSSGGQQVTLNDALTVEIVLVGEQRHFVDLGIDAPDATRRQQVDPIHLLDVVEDRDVARIGQPIV